MPELDKLKKRLAAAFSNLPPHGGSSRVFAEGDTARDGTYVKTLDGWAWEPPFFEPGPYPQASES